MSHTHELPLPDDSWCSCCRKSIIAGLQNVVRVNKNPEKILDLEGNQIGVEGEVRPKAYFHTECFKEHFGMVDKAVECKYCGVFSMAKKLANGTDNSCLCSCHTAGKFCSLIIL